MSDTELNATGQIIKWAQSLFNKGILKGLKQLSENNFVDRNEETLDKATPLTRLTLRELLGKTRSAIAFDKEVHEVSLLVKRIRTGKTELQPKKMAQLRLDCTYLFKLKHLLSESNQKKLETARAYLSEV